MVLRTKVHLMLLGDKNLATPEQKVFDASVTSYLFTFQTSKMKNQIFNFG